MATTIPDGDWQSIDPHIFANRKLEAVIRIRAVTGCGLHESLDIFSARYQLLRAARPERFECSDEEYWIGFYS
jgi:hypothetical protein